MNPVHERLSAIVQRCADEAGMICLEATVHPQKRQIMIQAFVDTPAGVTLDQCAALSRSIALAIDAEFPDELYELHVGSPGIERPLEHAWQFEKNSGRMVRLFLEEDGAKKSVELRLADIDGDTVRFTKKNGTAVEYKRNDISHVVVLPEIGQHKH